MSCCFFDWQLFVQSHVAELLFKMHKKTLDDQKPPTATEHCQIQMRGKQRELQLFLWNWCGLLQIAIVQWYLRTHQYSFEVKFCETEPNEDCSCPLVSWRTSLLEVTPPTCHVSNSLFHPDVCAAQDPTNSTWLCITQHPSTQPGNVRFQRPWNAFAVWSRWWKSWAMWRVDAYGAVPGC